MEQKIHDPDSKIVKLSKDTVGEAGFIRKILEVLI